MYHLGLTDDNKNNKFFSPPGLRRRRPSGAPRASPARLRPAPQCIDDNDTTTTITTTTTTTIITTTTTTTTTTTHNKTKDTNHLRLTHHHHKNNNENSSTTTTTTHESKTSDMYHLGLTNDNKNNKFFSPPGLRKKHRSGAPRASPARSLPTLRARSSTWPAEGCSCCDTLQRPRQLVRRWNPAKEKQWTQT